MPTATPKPTGWKVMHVAADQLETALNHLTTEGWFVFKVFQDEANFPRLNFTIICREKNRSAAWAMKYELTKIRKSIKRTEDMQVEANATIESALAAQNKRFTEFIDQTERELDALDEPSPASPLLADAPHCTCGDIYAGFPKGDPEPNQLDSTCPVHGSRPEPTVMDEQPVAAAIISGELVILAPPLEVDRDFAPHTGTSIADIEATVAAHDGSGVQAVSEGDVFSVGEEDFYTKVEERAIDEELEAESDALLDEAEVDELVEEFFTANAPEPEPVSSAPIDDAAKLDNLFADRSDSNTSGLLGL